MLNVCAKTMLSVAFLSLAIPLLGGCKESAPSPSGDAAPSAPVAVAPAPTPTPTPNLSTRRTIPIHTPQPTRTPVPTATPAPTRAPLPTATPPPSSAYQYTPGVSASPGAVKRNHIIPYEPVATPAPVLKLKGVGQ